MKWNHLGNFGRGPLEEQLCDVILNLGDSGLGGERRCLKKSLRTTDDVSTLDKDWSQLYFGSLAK